MKDDNYDYYSGERLRLSDEEEDEEDREERYEEEN